MQKSKKLIIIYFTLFGFITTYAQNIFRFEHYNSKDGLSQNTVSSILCDRKGYLWIGTMNGLNRFDGYQFKIFKSETKDNSFTNNRVTKLWQDQLGYIWMETYDHYFHFFNPSTETFGTVPNYNDPYYKKINESSCFLQFSPHEIWIGTKGRGTYYLHSDNFNQTYTKQQISDKGKYTISNNDVRFILSDSDSTLWVGTKRGINLLEKNVLRNNSFDFQHLFINYSFNSGVEFNQEIWFATDDKGIIIYNKKTSSYNFINSSNNKLFANNQILKIYHSNNNQILIALKNEGLLIYDLKNNAWNKVLIHGKNVENVYFDQFKNAWITTENFGVTRINLKNLHSETYQLTEQIHIAITDRERHVFYEDKDTNLWIGLHGGALAFYHRAQNRFIKYVNNPAKTNSISSNIVHCITEDLSGQMWLGTGQYNGGLEKVIKRNPAFNHLLPTKNITQIIDNLTRSITQDSNGCIWMGTKNGKLHIYSKDFKKIREIDSFLPKNTNNRISNVYSIFIDDKNYIWLGTKGQGILVSKSPIPVNISNYKNIKFANYTNIIGDSSSISNNNIYSIEQDCFNNIWIGTYGNGICRTKANHSVPLRFQRYNSSNSQLSNNLVRKIKFDSDSNLWVATSFGINLLVRDSLKNNHIKFKSFFKSNQSNDKINYNDIIDIYEDSNKQLWFGTFGGGVSKLSLPLTQPLKFTSLTSKDGLSNDVIFGILEDDKKKLWFSSEYGLSRYDEKGKVFEIFNESNGLSFNNFSESTCCKLKDGRLMFGGAEGIEIINPVLINKPTNQNSIELTNFQVFNKDMIVGAKNSPLQKSISFTNEIELAYNQSSFSIEYSALDYLDPGKIQYAFILKGSEDQWNYVGNQIKATYTNLPHGSYTFIVKNTDRSGQWNKSERKLYITILPPWWKTPFAYAIYMLNIFALLLFVRFIVIRINKYRNDLSLEKKINELKLRFFTNISHEIRTPLTLILGPLEDILNESSLSVELKRQLSLMKNNTNRMLQLVNQLLDFRKIQNNKMSLNIQQIELNSFTQNIYESFIPLSKHNGITLKLRKHDEKIFIWADVVKLDSIIYNLVSNAIKFTPKGKNVSVSIQINDNTHFAEVNVHDEGPGISNENISDIFTRYVILNSQDRRGSGIGLSLAYELAKMHGGNIKIESEVGKGSSFCFSIPLEKSKVMQQSNVTLLDVTNTVEVIKHQNDITQSSNRIKKSLNGDFPVILIVEDNEQIALYIKNRLETLYHCYIAENGREGLKMTAKHNPDVIITDVMMPVLDGIEMTKKLKDDFATCHIPIIMMTAKTDIQDQITGFNTGAEAYITKPLNCEYLKAVIQSQINQRKLLISKYRDNKTIDPKTLKVNSKDEVFLQTLINYIEENYSKDLSVENVAEYCCVSRTVLYNKIKGLSGLSPLEFIRQIKLKVALKFLQNGYSVSETAFQIGYTDVKYFSKQFKLMYGYTPSKVKNK